MLEDMGTPTVLLAMNRRYFIEDTFLVVDCYFDQKKMRPMLRDWIGLYPCENMKLTEPLIFEYVMDHPTMNGGRFKIKFISQLFTKYIHCSNKYRFVYVDSYFKVIASSNPIEFVHKNDCNCNNALSSTNCMAHMRIGQDMNVVFQRLKCLEARLHDYEEGKKGAMQLNEQLVEKLKACEMLRSRGEQFIDGLYNALDQGKPVKLTNSKGYTRWIKRMHTSEVKSYMVSSKTVKNDLYLTAIINTQEKSLQRLQAINNELKIQYSKYHEHLMHISKPEVSETDDIKVAILDKTFTVQSISSKVLKFIDDSDNSDDYCE